MNEKNLALIGVAALFVSAIVGHAIAGEKGVMFGMLASMGAGHIVNLWKLGANTEKTEQVSKACNGLTDKRVEAAYREAYARGLLDGAETEKKRVAELAEKVKEAAKEAIIEAVPGVKT